MGFVGDGKSLIGSPPYWLGSAGAVDAQSSSPGQTIGRSMISA